MYGTREELCQVLSDMFETDDQIALLVWSEMNVWAACEALAATEEEVQAVLEIIGETPMHVYQKEGITAAAVAELLTRHREAVSRHVSVPADKLARLIACAEKAFGAQREAAGMASKAALQNTIDGMEEICALGALLNARP